MQKNDISYTTIRQYLYPPPTEILATRLAQAYTLLKYAECRPGDMFLPFAADAYGVYLY